jgi:predicted small metal-binding protein
MTLYSITCDPACGFIVQSHNKAETMMIAKQHVKNVHKKEVSDAEVQGMMKEMEM